MKFALLNLIAHLRSFIVIAGLGLVSVCQALSLEPMIAFCSDRAKQGGNCDIFVMKTDGDQPRNLTADPMSDDYSPAWSPDGTKIAFSSERLGNQEIYVMDADGENLVQLTRHRAYDASPSWSPDGRKIAFTSDRDHLFVVGPGQIGDTEIYVMNADGKNIVRLMKFGGWNHEPSWSPDGRKIAFVSEPNRSGNLEIYVMEANGKNPVRLTRNPGWDADPSWSPDGTKIAFESRRNENMDIYTIETDGGNLVRLTKDPASDSSPSWSPNGRKIAYASKRNENFEIYVMDADGGNPTNLTRDPALDSNPAWSPVQLAISPKTRLLMLWATIKTPQR